MTGRRLWTPDFLLLCLANFFLYCSFYVYLPILPLYIVEELGGREDQVGVLIGIFTITALAIRPWTEMLVGKFGRRAILTASLFFFTVMIGGYMAALSITTLLIIRLLHGGAYGLSTTVSSTAVADEVPESRRGEGIGYFVNITMVAMAVGPLIGPLVVDKWSYQILFVVSLFISFLAWALANFIKMDRHARVADPSPALPMRLRTMYEPRVLRVAIAMFLLALGFGGVMSFVWLYSLKLNVANIGGFFFVIFAVALIGSRLLSGKLYDSFGPNVVIYPGLVLFFAGILLLGLSNNPVVFLFSGLLVGSGYGSLQPGLQTLSIDLVADNRRGVAMATFLSFIDLGIGVGAMLLGVIIQFFGYGAMFFTICMLTVVSGLIYNRANFKLSIKEEGRTG